MREQYYDYIRENSVEGSGTAHSYLRGQVEDSANWFLRSVKANNQVDKPHEKIYIDYMKRVTHSIISEHRGDLKLLCENFRVAKLYVFGSAVNGNFDESSSDIDFLAQFKEREPTADYAERFFGLEEGLVSVFKRPVDLVTVEGLKKPGFRDVVERTRELVYESDDTL